MPHYLMRSKVFLWFFFFSSRRRHTRLQGDWSSDVCSSDLYAWCGLEWIGLRGVGLDPGPYSDTIPHQAYMVFQLMFAVITPALITGAFAERIKFSTSSAFSRPWPPSFSTPLPPWSGGKAGGLEAWGA